MSWQIKQNLNFYIEEFQPPKIPRELRLMITSAAVHVMAMVVIAIGLMSFWFWQGSELKNAQEQQRFLEKKIVEIQALRPPLVVDARLAEQRDLARRQLEGGQKVLRYLTQQQLEEGQSFTQLVSQLGDQNVKGVWLNQFSISDQGRHIGLQGYVDDPAKISKYVSTLVEKSAYQRRAFRYIDVQKEDDKQWLRFQLDTRGHPQDLLSSAADSGVRK
tara:strand:+ start:936 stop:1586 length:651 start_codon:yes stop_codon:yes gene_type:complete